MALRAVKKKDIMASVLKSIKSFVHVSLNISCFPEGKFLFITVYSASKIQNEFSQYISFSKNTNTEHSFFYLYCKNALFKIKLNSQLIIMHIFTKHNQEAISDCGRWNTIKQTDSLEKCNNQNLLI